MVALVELGGEIYHLLLQGRDAAVQLLDVSRGADSGPQVAMAPVLRLLAEELLTNDALADIIKAGQGRHRSRSPVQPESVAQFTGLSKDRR
ncbi:hypothetical protein [Kitasatospora sp. NPDC001175]|uniref:Uncharacterized protein n=1 Tax=Kitasatospora cystarginea TaxID=58350 RepID=A0ABN3EYF3_9ACTN